MFNVGGMELIVIGLVALVVLGPDKLPGAMRQIGTVLGELRRISQGFQSELRTAFDEAERDAERQRRAAEQANRGGAPATNADAGTAPDPGAAMAAARAELDAIEAARDDAEAERASRPTVGSDDGAGGDSAGTGSVTAGGPDDAPTATERDA